MKAQDRILELLKEVKELQTKNDQLRKAIRKDPDTKYLYFRLDLDNIPEEWDYVICETLDEVMDQLKYLEIHLDDDSLDPEDPQRRVIITGVGMTPIEYAEYFEKSMHQ